MSHTFLPDNHHARGDLAELGHEAFRLHHCGLTASDRGGFLDARDVRAVARGHQIEDLEDAVAELLREELWMEVAGGYQVVGAGFTELGSPGTGRPSPARTVYLIQAGPDGPLKIGVAADVAARLRQLQTGCPQSLRLVRTWDAAPGATPEELEADLHRRYGDLRLQGEWFSCGGDLRQLVAEAL